MLCISRSQIDHEDGETAEFKRCRNELLRAFWRVDIKIDIELKYSTVVKLHDYTIMMWVAHSGLTSVFLHSSRSTDDTLCSI